jgi:predicted nucleic acid-binding protein
VAGDADAIVTGDRAMLALGRYRKIQMLSLKRYLEPNAGEG